MADAITTARVFFKLKEMDDGAASSSLDDMLYGFEDFWKFISDRQILSNGFL